MNYIIPLFIPSDDYIGALVDDIQGRQEIASDDGMVTTQADCQAALDWLEGLDVGETPFMVTIPARGVLRATIATSLENLADLGEPGAYMTWEVITNDIHRRRLFEAAEGWKDATSTREALEVAWNAAARTGAAPGVLLVLCDLLAQRGLINEDDTPLLGGADDYLTTLCDIAMRG